MRKLMLHGKEVPLITEYDVVIVGGGTAGTAAAISCARENLKTLIIEQFGALGGSQTMGLVNPMMHNHIEGNPYSSAIDEEICDKMIEYGYGIETMGGNKGGFDCQLLKVALEELVIEAGCHILYHTSLIDVIKNEQTIEAVIIHNKDGISAIQAKQFIDCTGDADVAYYAGLPMQSGNKSGMNQAVSLRFQMTNVNCDKFGDYLESLGQDGSIRFPHIHTAVARGKQFPLTHIFEEKCAEGVLAEQDLKYFQLFSVPGKPRDLAFNCPELGGKENILDANWLSKKQIEGKKAIIRLANFLKKDIPGFEEAYISDIAPMLGIRESRRIIAEYQLRKEDVFEYVKFEDAIVRSNYPIDIHAGAQDENLEYNHIDMANEYYEIPYRSLVPRGVDNLLVAGRCIGTDFYAQSAIRIQQSCRAMGEAAGLAAKQAIELGKACRDIDGKEIRAEMIARGAKL